MPKLEALRSPAVAPVLLVATSVAVWGCTPRVRAEAGSHAGPLTLTSLRAAPTALVLLALLPYSAIRTIGLVESVAIDADTRSGGSRDSMSVHGGPRSSR